ncbi:MAG: hypothetical protein KDB22_30510, partial [Planctomycetales bacterium]|nr:hypothetical protein [Planctomycetales bacterium]
MRTERSGLPEQANLPVPAVPFADRSVPSVPTVPVVPETAVMPETAVVPGDSRLCRYPRHLR